MAIDYSQRLSNLRLRRNGVNEGLISLGEALQKGERYEKRAATTATRYALGAMQEVDPDYTRIGREEADRVSDALAAGLREVGSYAYYRLQGSVPLNVHIRGASDVDLLVLLGEWLTYDRDGIRANSYSAYTKSGTVLDDVIELRARCETILQRRYWESNVDTSGDKSIKLSEGSFRRVVDVVPSHWFDTKAYQSNAAEADRGVNILDKPVPTTLFNLPFLHIAKIEQKDLQTGTGAKRSIRLLKNLKADTDRKIELSSYVIAALMWHCEDALISVRPFYELSVLAGTEQYLSALASNYVYTSELQTPDSTRKIIDSSEKFTSLVDLSLEVTALTDAVTQNCSPCRNQSAFSKMPFGGYFRGPRWRTRSTKWADPRRRDPALALLAAQKRRG